MTLSSDISASKAVRLVISLLLLLLAVLLSIACVGHVFSWMHDQSFVDSSILLSEVTDVDNEAGSIGSIVGYFMVDRCLGLGAFVLCIYLFVAAFKVFRSLDGPWIRLFAQMVFASLLCSVIFGYVVCMTGSTALANCFGGGIGGGCGSYLAVALDNMLGPWVTGLLLAILLVILLFMTSPFMERRIGRAMDLAARSGDAPDAASDAVSGDTASDVSRGAGDKDSEEGDALSDGDSGDVVSGGAVSGDISGTDDIPVEIVPLQGAAVAGTLAADAERGDGSRNPEVSVSGGTEVSITGPEDELSTDIEQELPRLDIRSDVDRYVFPPLNLLEDYADKRYSIPNGEIENNIEKIKNTLASFRIPVQGMSASVGYTVTLYRIVLGEGVRVNSVKNLEDDIAIKIGIKGVRVVMLADAVGIEVPNQKPSVVPLKAILNSDAFRNSKGELPIALGYTITTKAKVFDLADAPHLLVAGATKQGKSVGLNAIISSLLYAKHPTELKFVFIDPKMVEFQKYSKLIRHYLALLPPLDSSDEADSAIVKDPKNAESVLRSLCVEMDNRYALLSAAGVNKVTDYNEKYSMRYLRPDEGHHFMPYLVVVVDEYADLTKSGNDRNLSRSIENSINRLAAKGRAAGLHVIIATQRPSVDVITGTIKGNFPTRMAFRTAQRQDSQTILGMAGAEKLIGKGDMLFFTGADAERVQCALVDSDEIEKLTEYISSQTAYKQACSQPYYLPDPGEPDGSSSSSEGGLVDMKNLDSMFEEAAKLVVMNGSMSTTLLQRKLQLGFARAGRLMDQLEAAGIVGPSQGARPREALVSDLASLQPILDAFIK